MIVRASTEADAEALARIYGHHVLHGLGSFEEIPPTPQDMAGRRAAIVALGLPHMVAEEAGQVAHRARPRDQVLEHVAVVVADGRAAVAP